MDESDKLLVKLKSERTQVRRLFTVCADQMEVLLQAEDKDYEAINILFIKLKDKADRLFNLDIQVNDIILLDDKSILDSDFDRVEEYRDRWTTLNFLRDNLFVESVEVKSEHRSCSPSVSEITEKKKKKLKLFKLEPKKFDGDIKDWIRFWAMFRRIHEDETIELEEKFQYLLQCTVDGSPARDLLNSFPPSSGNYEKAVEQLKRRFGREDLLKQLYIRELLKLVLIQATGEQNLSLSNLYDRLETQLRALETLGITSDKFSFILSPLVESALPEVVLRQWERQRSSYEANRQDEEVDLEGDAYMQKLLLFVRREVESEERLSLAKSAFSSTSKGNEMDRSESFNIPSNAFIKSKKGISKNKVPTATELVCVKSDKKNSCCIFCGGSHASENCFKARGRSIEENQKILKDNSCCYICLKKGHNRRYCRAAIRCIICAGRHVPLLCPQRKEIEPGVEQDRVAQVDHNNLSSADYGSIVMQTLLVKLRELTVRILIDTGSQRSYITKRIVNMLKFAPVGEVKLRHALFGGVSSKPTNHFCYRIGIQSMSGDYFCNFEALDSEEICTSLPVVRIDKISAELANRGIVLAEEQGGPIDILIGADMAGRLLTGRREVLRCGMVALETFLGWTIIGKIGESSSTETLSNFCLLSTEYPIADLWRLETLGIEDPAQVKSREEKEQAAKAHFEDSLTIDDNGRYEVRLPWLEDHLPLPRNFILAKKRFESTYKKLLDKEAVAAYKEVFMQWLDEGIIEEVAVENWDVGHYMPHRPVFKEVGTTRIRPVFDASAREKGQPSLNQCLEKGPNLIELIPSLILRFRINKFGLISDVKKAFLQISLKLEDRDFLRFIWTEEDGKNLRIFRHARVVFGVSSSPFLLAAVIEHHLIRCIELTQSGELSYSVNVLSQLQRAFYIDNCVVSLSTKEEVQSFINEATSIFSRACFELRGWECSDPNLLQPTETPVLGLFWDRKEDTLKVNLSKFKALEFNIISRRVLLSMTQSIFDPIGVMAPTTLVPKLLIQKSWSDKAKWDSPVPEETRKRFIAWVRKLHYLEGVRLPRWLSVEDEAVLTLHTFCDASQLAFAAVVFLRVEFLGGVNIQLVGAKSRVAPLKGTTIPRLELLAAMLGARLAFSILKDLPTVIATYYWSDSTTTLAWIQREESWNVFVWNRVREIRALSNKDCWHHVPGCLNPADLASRGCSPDTLLKEKWWEGPHWLKLPDTGWPHLTESHVDEEEVLAEKKKVIVSSFNLVKKENCLEFLFTRISSYTKIVRCVAWIYRFSNNCRTPAFKVIGLLSNQEIIHAERKVLGCVQCASFEGVKDKRILKLKPFIDQLGVVRSKTRLWARADSEDFRAPVILPPEHIAVERLIYEVHSKNGHIVGQGLLNLLRERYWVLKGRQTIKRIVNKCVICRRYTAASFTAETPPLPEDRIRDARVFEVCGTDFAGPLFLKDGQKAWICLFTCAVYRAVHLEVVISLSTESFMRAFRRFIARRGRPKIMYSDNGTNFKGFDNAIKKLNWIEIASHFSIDRIEWRFNPPTASWWGGFWERLIGILKSLFRRTLGKASLNLEELQTVVCEGEALINSRPITYLSENIEDPIPITPRMFLQELQEEGVPDFDVVDSKSLNRRIRFLNDLRSKLKERFRIEYLGQLSSTCGAENSREPVIGEVVLIGSDHSKKVNWPVAVVDDLVRGRDGICRLVKLRTADGRFERPIQRVFPLEVFSHPGLSESSQQQPEEETSPQPAAIRRTRCGRKVEIPARFQF